MTVLEKIQRDDRAFDVARALALANETAALSGMDPTQALITITEEYSPERLWRIHYGPRDYIHRRGGDITIVVEGASGEVKKVLRGQ